MRPAFDFDVLTPDVTIEDAIGAGSRAAVFPCTRAWAERCTDVQCAPHPSSGVSEKYPPIGWGCLFTNLHSSPKSYQVRPLQRRASKLGRFSHTPFPGLATGPAHAVCCKAGVMSSLGAVPF